MAREVIQGEKAKCLLIITKDFAWWYMIIIRANFMLA